MMTFFAKKEKELQIRTIDLRGLGHESNSLKEILIKGEESRRKKKSHVTLSLLYARSILVEKTKT